MLTRCRLHARSDSICITITRLIDIRQGSYLRLCFKLHSQGSCLVASDPLFESDRRQAPPEELTQANGNNTDASSSYCSRGDFNRER